MNQLLEIRSVPIKLQTKVTHANLEYTRPTVELKMSREPGGIDMKRTSPQIKIDTFEARNSICPTPIRSVEQNAQKGKENVQQVMANYAQQGKMLLEAKVGQELITQFAKEIQFRNVKTNVGIEFIPKTGPKFEYIPGEINTRYTAEKVHYECNWNKIQSKYHRGDVDISVTQYPDVIINYTGSLTNAPTSQNSNYKPIDVRV